MDASWACLLALDLVDIPDLSAAKVVRVLYGLSNRAERHYRKIVLAKADGGSRTLLVPSPVLKNVQRNILKNVLAHFPVSSFATAYRPGLPLSRNACAHQRQPQLLKLDIERFFDNISWLQVWHLFRQTTLPVSVVTLLTHLCCCYERLPQGAPTSPAISNLVMCRFDEQIGQWCREREIIYTRYCDDMTFSGDFCASQVQNKVRGLLAEMGLRLNQRKRRLMTADKRQMVTGVVVNEKPQLARDRRRALRQEIYYCRKYGVISHLMRSGRLDELTDPNAQARRYLHSLQGRVAWVLQINPEDRAFCRARQTIRGLLAQLDV